MDDCVEAFHSATTYRRSMNVCDIINLKGRVFPSYGLILNNVSGGVRTELL